MGFHSIQEGLESVHALIDRTLDVSGRPRGSVCLVAVSKTQSVEAILEALRHGQHHFGENYLQEALPKQEAMTDHQDIIWHFIGPIQSNKTRLLAERFSWIHSLDRLKIAERLNDQRPPELGRLNVCLQVNISGESTKSGVHPSEISSLAEQIQKLPNLWLRGLMTIPESPAGAAEDPRSAFARLRQLQEGLSSLSLDTLSMGMSQDFEDAILEGSTMIRVGSRIFGPRQRPL